MRCSRYQKDTAENVTDWDRSLDLSLSLLPRACSRWPRECQNQLCGRRQACSWATLRAGQDPRALCPAFPASWAKASRRKRSKGGWIPPSSNDFKPFEHGGRRQPAPGRPPDCLPRSFPDGPMAKEKIFLGNFARTGRWGGESRCSENRRSRRSAERHGGRQYRESGWEPGRGRLDSGRDDPAQGRRQPLHRDGKPPTRVGERRERERRRRSRLTN